MKKEIKKMNRFLINKSAKLNGLKVEEKWDELHITIEGGDMYSPRIIFISGAETGENEDEYKLQDVQMGSSSTWRHIKDEEVEDIINTAKTRAKELNQIVSFLES